MTTITIERALLEQALNALLLPCDRWNKQQFLIVKGAIESLNAALAAPATAPATAPEQKSCQCLEPCMSCFEREKKPATAPERPKPPLDPDYITIGDPVKASPVGPGKVTDITNAGYPRVNDVAVAWMIREDGSVFNPRCVPIPEDRQ